MTTTWQYSVMKDAPISLKGVNYSQFDQKQFEDQTLNCKHLIKINNVIT